MPPVSTPAVLLRAYAFGETSRILRFYTRDLGLLSVMARGVRARSGKGAATLQTFATGDLVAYVKPQRDLHTMKDFACARVRSRLGADVVRFAGASLLAEIMGVHTDQHPNPEVFGTLEESLDALEDASGDQAPWACLSGAWRLVAALGFAPELDGCVRCAEPLAATDTGRFDFAAGGLLCAGCAEGFAGPRVGPGARLQLRGLLAGGAPETPFTHPRRHLGILADFLACHVAQQPLRSLRFLADVLPPDPEA